ncbi:MAG: hypothetical protein B7Z80_07610 [Rhodospirillales bacterium 20-64-7]|nr:MAG: hypothetical protein B7Z80_07610 [Rhodospirillales bacterium 20-64-7]
MISSTKNTVARKLVDAPVLRGVLNINDFQARAKRILPHTAYAYVANGSEDSIALEENYTNFERWRLRTRVLVGAEHQDQQRQIFGRSYKSPFGIAPMGASALVAYDGDTVMARAARQGGIPFILSGNSIVPMEEVAAQYPGAWFASYQSPNAHAIEGMVERVTKAGFGVFVQTVDVPVGSNRENEERAGYSMPLRPTRRLAWDGLMHPRWLAATAARTMFRRGVPHLDNLEYDGGPSIFSNSVSSVAAHKRLSWDHIRLIRKLWKGPFVLKGILSAEDARIARDCGVDGIIVSNHGGRQLDRAVTPLQVLPEIVEAVPELTVMIDSGFRRGTEILTALALGARFVFIGRPFLFAAAIAGESGVSHGISLMQKEIETDMALLGLPELDAAGPDMLVDMRDRAR